jgi:hypothetical protein
VIVTGQFVGSVSFDGEVLQSAGPSDGFLLTLTL